LSVVSRTITGQIHAAYHYLEFIPSHQEWLLGRSFPNPRSIFPFDQYDLTKEISAWNKPHMADRNVVGSMPTIFWGEAYANFGIYGVLILSTLVGYLIYSLNWWIFTQGNSPILISLFAWLVFHIINLSGTGFSKYIIDTHLISIMMLYFVLKINISFNRHSTST
jgi:hypothetical protein